MSPTQDLLDHSPTGGLLVETEVGSPSRIRLTGELDYGTAPRLKTALSRFAGSDCVIDCRDLTFVDSLGIGVLVRFSCAFEERHQRLVLCNLHESVRRTLEICGVLDRFEVDDERGHRAAR
jgi:stage II sporulation protein AA (anti-sigma F factor antagonist)